MHCFRRIKVLLTTCMLACTSLFAQDVKISISSATATSEQSGEEASYAIDGNVNTFWHSQWSWGAVFDGQKSVDLTITLAEVSLVDYVRYIPRQNSNQGHWGEVEVAYCSTTSGAEFTTVGTFQLGKASMPCDFSLGVECGQVKFTIRSGSNNHATAAEIEAYQISNEIKSKAEAFANYFTDDLYTQLKSDVTSSDGIEDNDVKTLVQSLLDDAEGYKKFRVGEYEPYMTTGTLTKRLGIKSSYNNYENPTGIYLKEEESCVVAVSGIGDEPVGLKIKNWYRNEASSAYALHNGINYITATTEGNVFVNYYTDNFENAPNVKVHFINAPVLGYWDQETMTNSDWVEILNGSLAIDSTIVITRSEHAQLAFPVMAWRQYCPENIDSTMTMYQQVQWAERDILGLEKYDLQCKNRQLYYATNYGFMAAGDEGAYCNYTSLGAISTPDSKVFDFWGVGHEWGHNNQIEPGFHWSGCGETTNNIYASWAQFHFTGNRDASGHPTTLRLEDEVTGINDYADMRGGRMQVYFEEGLRKGVAWQLQDGPDYHDATPEEKTVMGKDADGDDTEQVTTTSRNYDHFVKLAPFWQLNLWGTLAGKCPDIIPMVIEAIRTTADYGTTYNTNGKQQMNWMKLACDKAQIDLLPFFEKAGMLRPIHAYIEDYGAGWNIITEDMITELKNYVETKGYPAYTEEINYINGHNYMIYRDELKLQTPTAFRTGCTRDGNYVTVQHSAVQNAVAFETYNSSDELVRITMYGLGSNDAHSFTQVLFPEDEDANYIMAVGYDGTRERIYDLRTTLDEELKAQLATLISDAESLINTCGTVTCTAPESQDELALQTTDANGDYYVSTNADQNTGGGTNDGAGIAALVDNNTNNYFHTRWGGTAVNENHYIQVDMGEGNTIQNFKFTYMARSGSPAPTEMTIYGSNDGISFTDAITDVSYAWNDENGNSTYTSEVIKANKAYRYLRFTVTKSNGPDTEQYGGYYFFGMREFDLISITPESYSAALILIGAVTEEQLIDVYCHKVTAQSVSNMESPTEAELQEAINELQAAYDVLYEAYNATDHVWLPVTLTTNIEKPILYTINSNRGEGKVLQYDPADEHTFSITDKVEGSAKQAFFFMEGDATAQVYIYPFAAGEQILAAEKTEDGARKVFAKTKGTMSNEQWTFEKQGEHYGLKPINANTYLSHHGGGTNKMGFYRTLNDPGTLMSFTQTTVTGSSAYNSLKAYYEETAKGVLEGSNNPGYYPESQAETYNEAYSIATSLYEAEMDKKSRSEYLEAYSNLLNANEALVMNMPEAGKYYVIRSAHTGYANKALAYADPSDNKLHWSTEKTTADATAIWTITPIDDADGFHICNLHTGTSIKEFIDNNPSPLNDASGEVNLKSISGDGQLNILCDGTMHAQDTENKPIVRYAGEANSASAWRIEEVTDMSSTQYTATIGDYRHTSLYLNYPTTIPEGIEAYIALNPDNKTATIELVKLEGNVLPANTGVILYGEPDKYSFSHTTDAVTDDVSANLLKGCAYAKYVGSEDNAYTYYIFGQKDGDVGLYWAKMNYDADGNEAEEADQGKYFKASANKIYFEWSNTDGAAMVSGLRFSKETTDIDIIESVDTEDYIIYNVLGQRLHKATVSGIYIVNGEKRYINVK